MNIQHLEIHIKETWKYSLSLEASKGLFLLLVLKLNTSFFPL